MLNSIFDLELSYFDFIELFITH